MATHETHNDRSLGPEQITFLEFALSRLEALERIHLQYLPVAIADHAGTAAFKTITNRAVSGVEKFHDDRGRQCREKIHAYVKQTVSCKVNGAYAAERTVPLDDERMATLHRGLDRTELLEHESKQDSLRKEAEAMYKTEWQHTRARDVERLNWLTEKLVEHGIKGHDATLVMLRAMRRWTLDITETGLHVNYVDAMPLLEVAERIGISHEAARARSSRTMRRLPQEVRWLIEHPEAFNEDEGANAAPAL